MNSVELYFHRRNILVSLEVATENAWKNLEAWKAINPVGNNSQLEMNYLEAYRKQHGYANLWYRAERIGA